MRKITIVVMIALVFVLPQADAQVEFNFSGAGCRAAAMGGAFVGLSDDATAIYWNPAGLAQLKRPEFSLMGSYVYQKLELLSDDATYDDVEFTMKHPNFNFGTLVLPLNPSGNNIVICAGAAEICDIYEYFEVDVDDNDELDAIEETNGGAYTLMLGGALEINKVLSVGLTVNRVFGGYSWTGTYADYYIDDESTEDYKFEGAQFFTVGVLAKLAPAIHIGATFKNKFTFSEKQTSHGGLSADEWMYLGEEYWRSYEMPQSLGCGIAIRASDSFTVCADFWQIAWEDFNWEYTNDGGTLQSTKDEPTWEPQSATQVHVGMELLVENKKGGFPMPLRFGYYTDPDYFEDAAGDIPVTKWITGGFGAIFPNAQLDLALMYGKKELKNDYIYDSTDVLTTIKGMASAIWRF